MIVAHMVHRMSLPSSADGGKWVVGAESWDTGPSRDGFAAGGRGAAPGDAFTRGGRALAGFGRDHWRDFYEPAVSTRSQNLATQKLALLEFSQTRRVPIRVAMAKLAHLQ